MTPEQKLAMSIALELKRLVSMKLCDQISLEQFRAQRAVLLESFRSVEGWSTTSNRFAEQRESFHLSSGKLA
jgi:hypothetical protein